MTSLIKRPSVIANDLGLGYLLEEDLKGCRGDRCPWESRDQVQRAAASLSALLSSAELST